MNYRKRSILFLLSILFFTNLPFGESQQSLIDKSVANRSLVDKIVVHTNQPYYITGDVMSFKVYFPSIFKSKEKVIRACLMKNDKSLIHESFLITNNKQSVSDLFKIPIDLSSGMYHLVLSSYHQELEKEIILAEVYIPIYSDLKNDLKSLQTNTEINSDTVTNTLMNIVIDIANSKIKTGSKIETKISVKDQNENPLKAEVSITVLDKAQMVQGYSSVHTFPSLKAEIINGLSNEIYLNGNIKSHQKKEKKKFPVVTIYSSDENKFSYLTTNNQGRFSVTVPKFQGIKKVQFINYDNEQINITLNTPEISKSAPALIVTEDLLSFLDWKRKRRKIEQVFAIAPQEIQKKQTTWQRSELENVQVYDLDTYESFEDMASLFSEVITPLRLKKQDDESYKAKVFNRERGVRGYYSGKPVFIVDGLVTKDATFINKIDLNMIKSISMISNLQTLKKLYGPIGQSGMVYVKTKLPEVRLPKHEMNNIMVLNGIRSAELIIDSANIGSSIPIFESNIYWASDLATDEKGTLDFEFRHSDDLGEFLIEVVARSENGLISRSRMTYNVAN